MSQLSRSPRGVAGLLLLGLMLAPAALAAPDEARVLSFLRDWSTAWQAEHRPFRVGRIVVAPPWDAPDGAVVVEPGQGFGTGQHPTTRAMLAAVDSLADECEACLDPLAEPGDARGVHCLRRYRKERESGFSLRWFQGKQLHAELDPAIEVRSTERGPRGRRTLVVLLSYHR